MRGEVAAGAGEQRRLERHRHRERPRGVALGLLLEGDGEHALVHAGLRRGWRRRSRSSRRREPAVCTRSIGLPTAPSASARYSSGIITPSKKSGALPMTTASMSAQVISASSSARCGGLADEAGHRDVVAGACVLGLADADDGDALLRHQSSPSRTHTRFCCRHGPAVAWATRPVGLAVGDAGGGLADADEAGGHHRVGGQRAARRVDRRRRRRGRAPRAGSAPGGVNGACSSATSTAPSATPAFSPAMRVDADRVRSRTPRSCGSMRWSMPRIHAGRLAHLAGQVAGREDDGGGAVGDRRQSCARRGDTT